MGNPLLRARPFSSAPPPRLSAVRFRLRVDVVGRDGPKSTTVPSLEAIGAPAGGAYDELLRPRRERLRGSSKPGTAPAVSWLWPALLEPEGALKGIERRESSCSLLAWSLLAWSLRAKRRFEAPPNGVIGSSLVAVIGEEPPILAGGEGGPGLMEADCRGVFELVLGLGSVFWEGVVGAVTGLAVDGWGGRVTIIGTGFGAGMGIFSARRGFTKGRGLGFGAWTRRGLMRGLVFGGGATLGLARAAVGSGAGEMDLSRVKLTSKSVSRGFAGAEGQSHSVSRKAPCSRRVPPPAHTNGVILRRFSERGIVAFIS